MCRGLLRHGLTSLDLPGVPLGSFKGQVHVINNLKRKIRQCKQSNLIENKLKHLYFNLIHIVIDQNMLSLNKVTLFYNHQYIWKEKFNVLDFCIEVVNKERDSKATAAN